MRAGAGTPAIARPGRARSGPVGRLPILILLFVLAVTACSPAGPGPTGSPGTAGPSAATIGPSGAASPDVTASPSEEPSVEPTEEPTAVPTASPERTPGPSGSPSAGAAGRCFGSNDTKDFFSSFAQEVPWPVYCAVLPVGWSVEKGTYRLKNGGRLTISYRRRADGARIVLDEGAVCQETTPCVPAGSSLGQVDFGDRQADLIDAGTAGLVAAVDQPDNPAWLLTGTGIDRAALSAIAGKLALIDQ
jgi:hypothetical protein